MQTGNLKKELLEFQNSFTKEQKASIVLFLLVVANCDKQLNSVEEKQMEKIAEILGIRLDDKIFTENTNVNIEDYIMKHAKTLSKSQKEWFLVCIYEVIISDGKMVQVEMNYLGNMGEMMGITESEFIALMQKSNAILAKFQNL